MQLWQNVPSKSWRPEIVAKFASWATKKRKIKVYSESVTKFYKWLTMLLLWEGLGRLVDNLLTCSIPIRDCLKCLCCHPFLSCNQLKLYLIYLTKKLKTHCVTVALMDCSAAFNHGLTLCSSWEPLSLVWHPALRSVSMVLLGRPPPVGL